MKTKNPNFRAVIQEVFYKAAFVQDVGIELGEIGPGWCETNLTIRPNHRQQDGVVHAGVMATLADHTAGAASHSLVAEDEVVLTAEFKISFLRPARADRLRCRSDVLKPGRTLIVAESEVFTDPGDESSMVAKAIVTLAVVSGSRGNLPG
jgi:uncharacterized protein (TIGR00369 family)